MPRLSVLHNAVDCLSCDWFSFCFAHPLFLPFILFNLSNPISSLNARPLSPLAAPHAVRLGHRLRLKRKNARCKNRGGLGAFYSGKLTNVGCGKLMCICPYWPRILSKPRTTLDGLGCGDFSMAHGSGPLCLCVHKERRGSARRLEKTVCVLCAVKGGPRKERGRREGKGRKAAGCMYGRCMVMCFMLSNKTA